MQRVARGRQLHRGGRRVAALRLYDEQLYNELLQILTSALKGQ